MTPVAAWSRDPSWWPLCKSGTCETLSGLTLSSCKINMIRRKQLEAKAHSLFFVFFSMTVGFFGVHSNTLLRLYTTIKVEELYPHGHIYHISHPLFHTKYCFHTGNIYQYTAESNWAPVTAVVQLMTYTAVNWLYVSQRVNDRHRRNARPTQMQQRDWNTVKKTKSS